MDLEKALELFHRAKPEGWGHSRKPAVFSIVNRLKSDEFIEGDMKNLVWHLHEHWDRLGTERERWAASTSEIRIIMAKRRERVAEMQKRTDKQTAERVIGNLHTLMEKA